MTFSENGNTFLKNSERICDILHVIDQASDVENYYRLNITNTPASGIDFPKTPTNYKEIPVGPWGMSPICYKNYIYYFDAIEANNCITREDLLYGSKVSLLYEDDDSFPMVSYSVMEDGRVIATKEIYEEFYRGYEFYSLNFDTATETLLYRWVIADELNEYPHVWCPIVCNQKLCILIDYEPTSYRSFMVRHEFLMIDIFTGEQYCQTSAYESGLLDSFLQYPWCPPTIVNNKVFFVSHIDESFSNPPVISVFNTETNTVDVVRPQRDSTNINLFQQTYNPRTNLITYIVWDNDLGYIMFLNPDTLEYTFSYETRTNDGYTANNLPAFILSSNTDVYILQENGEIYNYDFTELVRTIPPMTIYGHPWLKAKIGYPDNLSKWIGNDGILWYVISNVLYGYPIEGGDPINTGVTLPPVPSGSWSRRNLFLTGGKLCAVDIDRAFPYSNIIYLYE